MGYSLTHPLSSMTINALKPLTVCLFPSKSAMVSHGEGLYFKSCCLISSRTPLCTPSHSSQPPSPSQASSLPMSQRLSWRDPASCQLPSWALPSFDSLDPAQVGEGRGERDVTPSSALPLHLPVPGYPRAWEPDGPSLLAGLRGTRAISVCPVPQTALCHPQTVWGKHSQNFPSLTPLLPFSGLNPVKDWTWDHWPYVKDGLIHLRLVWVTVHPDKLCL